MVSKWVLFYILGGEPEYVKEYIDVKFYLNCVCSFTIGYVYFISYMPYTNLDGNAVTNL